MWLALDLSIRAAIVLVLAWLAAASLRRQAAAVRALVWAVAFAGLLALPIYARIAPAWHLPLVLDAPRIEAPPVPQGAQAAQRFSPAIPEAPAPRLSVERVSDPLPLSVVPDAPAPASQRAPVDWSLAALALSAFITSLLLIRIVLSHVRISRLVSRAHPADAAWTSLVDEIRPLRGIRRAVTVRVSDAVNVPAVVGVFRPALLVPSDATAWDSDTRRAVALHELAHVARWDALAQLLEQVACAIYWFNPLAWYGARRAAALRERASDDEVIRAGMSGPLYAQRLLDLLRSAPGTRAPLASLAMARPSRMRERVVAILDPVARREGVTMRNVVAAVVVSSCAIAAVAAAAPEPTESLVLKPASMATAEARFSAPAAPAFPSEPVAPAAPAPATYAMQSGWRFCSGDMDNHQHMQGERNGRKTLTIKLSGSGCLLEVKSEGRITFNDDFTDIAALESGGYFHLTARDSSGTRRELEIDSRSGGLSRRWRVDGREIAFDASAQQWFANFLIDLDRRTAIGVETRLPHLLRRGGVNAVLDETGQMGSDFARNVYYLRLDKTTKLSSADVTRVLQQAAKMTKSDHYANELVQAMSTHGLGDPAQRMAVTQLINTMDSDHYRAESVEALVTAGRPGAEEMTFLVGMLAKMESDHYKVQVLTKVLNGATLTPEHQAMLAQAASNVESDHYAAEFLKTIASKGTMPAPVRQSWLASVRNVESDHYASEILRTLIRKQRPQGSEVDAILSLAPSLQSDHYRAEVLQALMESPDLSERDLLGIISAGKPMSDHYESETLRKVVRHARATDRVRSDAIAAAEQMSSHYREEVRRSAGGR